MSQWSSALSTPPNSDSAKHQDVADTSAPFSYSKWVRRLPPAAQTFLRNLLEWQLIPVEAIDPFLETRFDRLKEFTGEIELGRALIEENLLTQFQLNRALAGRIHGLVLGNYRILEELGKGGMGAVYLGEHRIMKRRVALKVVPVDDDLHHSILTRFYGEMRVLADLQHPNIVTGFDAGEVPTQGPNMPMLIYLVMELVSGGNLESYVVDNGPCSIARGCEWIRQAAEGLQAAHDKNVVHRDIKPSNLLLTDREQLKVVDFGLARQFCSQLTDPRSLLGSVEFMAPEQSHDPSRVGTPADIYGLGATLFWLLTGEPPYPFTRNIGTALRALQREEPRKLRTLRPEAPEGLEVLIAQMLARDPAHRPSSLLRVSSELSQFATQDHAPIEVTEPITPIRCSDTNHTPKASCSPIQTLLIDNNPTLRMLFNQVFGEMKIDCEGTSELEAAYRLLDKSAFDLILVDQSLLDNSTLEVVLKLRSLSLSPTMKMVLLVGEADKHIRTLPPGVDDLLVKPCEYRQVQTKVRVLLRLQEAENQVTLLAEQLKTARRDLEESVVERGSQLRKAHDALLYAMARMAESRDGETSGHLRRLQRYVCALAEEAANSSAWKSIVDSHFLEQLNRCVPLHDIGKLGLPDEILRKPSSLTPDERALVQTHPKIGDRILESLAQEHGHGLDFLSMARLIVRHHHEQFDGKGYPDGLKGDSIPPAARLLHLADVYDGLRRPRFHKRAMSHESTVKLILGAISAQFDPTLLDAFERCHSEFENIFREVGD